MKSQVEFDHSIGDRVKIVDLDGCQGVVETMSATVDGLNYRVGYWHDGKRFSEWVRGDELSPK